MLIKVEEVAINHPQNRVDNDRTAEGENDKNDETSCELSSSCRFRVPSEEEQPRASDCTDQHAHSE